MRSSILLFLFLLLSGSLAFSQDCADCEKLTCDGVNCDDGSSADGVQTSRNCSCGKEISGACAYVEIDLSLNPYFNPNDSTCSLLFRSQESGNFSIYYLDDQTCTVTDCQSPDFVISGDQTFNNLPSDGFLRMYICKNGGNAGRRDFTFSITCTTIENCVNLIDDDLDLWIDCEDGDCNTSTYCNYTETSSSSDGGLESNADLSQKIARRNYIRSSSAKNLSSRENQPLYETRKIAQRLDNAFQLADAIPAQPIEGIESRVSSPGDLIGITNASEVFSTDLYQKTARIGSILATRSENGVYEHSKYICDRLNGARVEKVVKTTIGDIPFLVTKFVRADGMTEYNTNFSFYLDNDSIRWESFWTLADYTKEKEFLNYQVWANHITNLETIIKSMISEIRNRSTIGSIEVGSPPPVLIHEVWYEKQQLKMRFSAPKSIDYLQLSGILKRTEQSAEEEFEYQQTISSDTIVVDMGGAYAMGVTLTDPESGKADAIYYADGSWGIDFIPGNVFVKRFDIRSLPASQTKQTVNRPIERGVSLQATVRTDLAIYRSMNAAYQPEDISRFNTFEFTTSGNNEKLEVVFIDPNISKWEDQPRKYISVTAEEKKHQIDLTSFKKRPDQVQMVVFKFTNSDAQPHELDLTISNVRFSEKSAEAEQVNKLTIAPNPIRDLYYISVYSDGSVNYHLTIYNLNGNTVAETAGSLKTGMNTIKLERPFSSKNGMYVYQFKTELNKEYSGRIIFE